MHSSDAIEVVEERCSHSCNRLRTMPSTVEIGMKRLIFAVCLICISRDLSAQKLDWQPSPEHTQVRIWPDTPPDAQPIKEKEFALSSGTKFLIARKPATEVDNVAQAKMTIYSPKGKGTGTAVIVFPGGGFYVLAIDLEGTEACDWLTLRGITCVLLKYRVPDSRPHHDSGHQKYPKAPMALEDAQRTMRLIRFRAAEYHIDPHEIGVLGFSARGYLVADISTNYDKLVYPVVDGADKVSCRPDCVLVQVPFDGKKRGSGRTRPNPQVAVPRFPQTDFPLLIRVLFSAVLCRLRFAGRSSAG